MTANECRIALEVIDIITRSCGRQWPTSIYECLPLLHRYGLSLEVMDGLPFGAHLRGNAIYISCHEDLPQIVSAIIHEVAEYMLRGQEEPLFQLANTQRDEYHEIACLVHQYGQNPNRLHQVAESQ